MNRFRLARQAKTDLSDIWDYIGVVNENPTAAYRQLEMLHEKFSLLAGQPLLGQSCDDLGAGVRVFSADSYVIFYVPIGNGIEVQRVIHGSRDIGSLF